MWFKYISLGFKQVFVFYMILNHVESTGFMNSMTDLETANTLNNIQFIF